MKTKEKLRWDVRLQNQILPEEMKTEKFLSPLIPIRV